MTDMDKCGAECEIYSHTFNRCSYEEDIRADEREKVFDKIMSFINTSNRGNCDYFIIDQIENYINSHK